MEKVTGYIANALLAGTLFGASMVGLISSNSSNKSLDKRVDFDNIKWCETDARNKTFDDIYFDFLNHYGVKESPENKTGFFTGVVFRNPGKLTEPKLMLPCKFYD